MHQVSSAEISVLKVSDDLDAILSKLSPDDALLLWLDVYIPPLPDGNVYLSSSDFSPITDIGVKVAGVTFSPDKQLLWYLVEARATQVSSLVSLSMVRKVSLATIGVWDWWEKNWRSETPIDPLLNLTMQRVNRDFPYAKVPVVINYAKVEQNETKESKQEIIGEITALVRSVGGEIVRKGIAEYILAKVPSHQLNRFSENKHVRTLEANQPLCLRGGSFRKSASISQSQLLMLLPLCAVCYSIRKLRKVKVAFIISLLVTSFLLLYSVPLTYALNVSRLAIRADQAGYSGDGVVVAVIDTGIDFNHGDLAAAIRANVDLTGQNDPMDYYGHGTHIAGIVASRSGTYTGIAYGSQIINVKVGLEATFMDDAIQWCIDNKNAFDIRIIQMSVGLNTEQPGDGTDPLSMKADEAVEAGIAVVVAVMDKDTDGDRKYELSNPEQAFNVIAVGAVNNQDTIDINDDTIAYDSSGGSTTDGRPKPDIVAPGDRTDKPSVGIWSTRSSQAPSDHYEAINGVYGRDGGVSQAAPHVSGTAALMLEANPNLTPAQIKAILKQTAILTNNLNGDARAGHGIINAYEAVQLAQNVNNINAGLMYDSFHVDTPTRSLGWPTHDYLEFNVDAPSSTYGIAVSDVTYFYYRPIPSGWDYKLINKLSAQHVWIDDAYYNLGTDMNKYLFSGPRIYQKGDGFANVKALYLVGGTRMMYNWLMRVDKIWLHLYYNTGSSWKTLIYIDPSLWDTTNFPYLPSTSEIVYYERKVTGDVHLYVRDLSHWYEYIEIAPHSVDNPIMWILRNNYAGNNPDSALNDEYTYDSDIAIFYQATSQSTDGGASYRKTDNLPTPDPPPTIPDTPSGPTSGYTPVTYHYTTRSTDPADNIHYEFDWGDGSRSWTGWYPSGETAERAHQWFTPGTKYVKVRAQDSNNAWSDWSLSLAVSIASSSGGGGGGCPYISTWDGTKYVLDNNVLPAAEVSNGTDVEDYCRLEQTLASQNGKYRMLLSEFEQEHSYIDQIRLLAVDHESDVNIAVTPEGEILTYKNPTAPISAVDNYGNDRLSEIRLMDGDVSDPATHFYGVAGDYLVLDFGVVSSENAKLILRHDIKCADYCIHVQVLDGSGQWQTVTSFIPRNYWAVEAVDLSPYIIRNQDFMVRLFWTLPHRLDYVGLDTTKQEDYQLQTANLVSATHSTQGDVKALLTENGNIYVELVPGEQIQLEFTLPNNTREARTYIMYTEGHYFTIP